MNKSTLKGNWNQLKGSIKQTWGNLTDDDLAHIDGSFDKLVGKIQERYGHLKDEVETQVNEWISNAHHHHDKQDKVKAVDTVDTNDAQVNTHSTTIEPNITDPKI